ncbi:MAG TPA: ABC transporter permease [Rhodothermales bacterium]|nr:ABC transporter permease [Rhodothermales bacterium]
MRATLTLARKELLHVFRDRVMVFQIFAAPVIQLLLISNAATFEVRHTRLALVDEDRSTASTRLVEAFTASGRFELALNTPRAAEADQAMERRQAGMILHVPAGFERDLRRTGLGEVQLILNAEDGAAAGVIQSYAMRILERYGAEEGARFRPAVLRRTPRLDVRVQGRYNPEGAYRPYMSVGLLALLMTLVGTLLTAQNIAREKERGTLEQLNVTPLSRPAFIAGKLLPFLGLGLVEFGVGLLVIRLVFGVPFEGSVAVATLGATVYLVAALGAGLLISTVVSTLQQAQFITFFVLALYLFLGGLFTPVRSMPEWAQTLAAFNPIKPFIELLRAVLLKGATLGDVLPQLGQLAALGGVLLSAAVLRYRKTTA